jgi:hypothetical protein
MYNETALDKACISGYSPSIFHMLSIGADWTLGSACRHIPTFIMFRSALERCVRYSDFAAAVREPSLVNSVVSFVI